MAPRTVDVWIPDNYSENKKYAVLYMHDGQMLFDADKTWNKQEWQVDETMDSLTKIEAIKDAIVVAIWNIPDLRYTDYFPKKPFELLSKKTRDSIREETIKANYPLGNLNSDNYLKFIVNEVKPFIDTEYSTLSDAENTVLMGSSMGGLISMYAISEYPNIFGGAACLSTHWIGTMSNNSNPIPEAFFTYMIENTPNSENHKLYFDYGTETLDAYYLPFQEGVTKVINLKGFDQNIRFEGHNHSENSWSKRLHISIEYLLSKNEKK